MTGPRLELSTIFGGLALLGACTVIVNPDPGQGLGTSCLSSEDCQGAECIDGICALRCGDSAGCPFGTVCASGACQVPLEVAFVYPFDLAQDDAGRALDQGREQAEEDLGYLASTADAPYMLSSEAVEHATELAASGTSVIVSASSLHADAFADFAAQTPDVLVLSYQGTRASSNLIPFDARTYQAYYLAGMAAARYTTSKRIGFVGSVMTPPKVADVNAFVLGAQRASAQPVTVELRWLREPHDTQPKVNGKSRERIFTEEMVAGGADVIAHDVDNGIPLFAVADLDAAGGSVFAIGANLPDACEALPNGRCIGATYFRWGPALETILDDYHRDQLDEGARLFGITASDTDSPVGFVVGAGISGATSLANDLDEARQKLATETGVGSIFDGPIASSGGQCEAALGTTPCVPEGSRVSDEQLATMCWLVDGIVDEEGMPATIPADEPCAPL